MANCNEQVRRVLSLEEMNRVVCGDKERRVERGSPDIVERGLQRARCDDRATGNCQRLHTERMLPMHLLKRHDVPDNRGGVLEHFEPGRAGGDEAVRQGRARQVDLRHRNCVRGPRCELLIREEYSKHGVQLVERDGGFDRPGARGRGGRAATFVQDGEIRRGPDLVELHRSRPDRRHGLHPLIRIRTTAVPENRRARGVTERALVVVGVLGRRHERRAADDEGRNVARGPNAVRGRESERQRLLCSSVVLERPNRR